jgi:hypothetical protein
VRIWKKEGRFPMGAKKESSYRARQDLIEACEEDIHVEKNLPS